MSVQPLSNSKDFDCNNIVINQTSHIDGVVCNELQGGNASILDLSTTNVTSDTVYANTIVNRDGGNVLLSNNTGGNVLLGNSIGGMNNPMTSVGDLIVGGSGGVPTRFEIGSNGTVLTSDGTNVSWSSNPFPTSGEIIFISYRTNVSGSMESKLNEYLPVVPIGGFFQFIGSNPNDWNFNSTTGQVTIQATGIYQFTFTLTSIVPKVVNNEFRFIWSVDGQLQPNSTLKYMETSEGQNTFLTGVYVKQVNAGVPVKLVQTHTSEVDVSDTEIGIVYVTIELLK
jgi:hypothetical protein